MTKSPNLKSEGLLPGPVVWSPLEAGVQVSAAEEPRALHAVIVSGVREAGQSAGQPRGGQIQLSGVETLAIIPSRDQYSI